MEQADSSTTASSFRHQGTREVIGCSNAASPSSFSLEQHLLIRFLEIEVADRVRELLRSNEELSSDKNDNHPFRIQFNDDLRSSTVWVDGFEQPLTGKIVELPNIIESQKTINGSLFHKSGNVSQIMLLSLNPELLKNIDESYVYSHG
ncbi:MAG: hypothetical protein MHPSP_004656, partial [Paramarteilia canceri]